MVFHCIQLNFHFDDPLLSLGLEFATAGKYVADSVSTTQGKASEAAEAVKDTAAKATQTVADTARAAGEKVSEAATATKDATVDVRNLNVHQILFD